jgi:hypothetical protein
VHALRSEQGNGLTRGDAIAMVTQHVEAMVDDQLGGGAARSAFDGTSSPTDQSLPYLPQQQQQREQPLSSASSRRQASLSLGLAAASVVVPAKRPIHHLGAFAQQQQREYVTQALSGGGGGGGGYREPQGERHEVADFPNRWRPMHRRRAHENMKPRTRDLGYLAAGHGAGQGVGHGGERGEAALPYQPVVDDSAGSSGGSRSGGGSGSGGDHGWGSRVSSGGSRVGSSSSRVTSGSRAISRGSAHGGFMGPNPPIPVPDEFTFRSGREAALQPIGAQVHPQFVMGAGGIGGGLAGPALSFGGPVTPLGPAGSFAALMLAGPTARSVLESGSRGYQQQQGPGQPPLAMEPLRPPSTPRQLGRQPSPPPSLASAAKGEK